MKKSFALILALLMCLTALAGGAHSHYMSSWRANGDGTHFAYCTTCRAYAQTSPCSNISCTVDGKELTLCPVCGTLDTIHGQLKNSTGLVYNYSAAPDGELTVYLYSDGLDTLFPDSGYLYALSAAFEYGGETEAYDGCFITDVWISGLDEFELLLATDEGLEKIDYEYNKDSGKLSFRVPGAYGLLFIK